MGPSGAEDVTLGSSILLYSPIELRWLLGTPKRAPGLKAKGSGHLVPSLGGTSCALVLPAWNRLGSSMEREPQFQPPPRTPNPSRIPIPGTLHAV